MDGIAIAESLLYKDIEDTCQLQQHRIKSVQASCGLESVQNAFLKPDAITADSYDDFYDYWKTERLSSPFHLLKTNVHDSRSDICDDDFQLRSRFFSSNLTATNNFLSCNTTSTTTTAATTTENLFQDNSNLTNANSSLSYFDEYDSYLHRLRTNSHFSPQDGQLSPLFSSSDGSQLPAHAHPQPHHQNVYSHHHQTSTTNATTLIQNHHHDSSINMSSSIPFHHHQQHQHQQQQQQQHQHSSSASLKQNFNDINNHHHQQQQQQQQWISSHNNKSINGMENVNVSNSLSSVLNEQHNNYIYQNTQQINGSLSMKKQLILPNTELSIKLNPATYQPIFNSSKGNYFIMQNTNQLLIPNNPLVSIPTSAVSASITTTSTSSNNNKKTQNIHEFKLKCENLIELHRLLEKEKTEVETELARHHPNKKVLQVSNINMIKHSVNNSRVESFDKALQSVMVTYGKVFTLVIKMEKLKSTQFPSNVYSALECWQEGIRKCQARRKEETVNSTNRQRSGVARDEKDIMALAAALGELNEHIRKIRTVLWACLQMTLQEKPLNRTMHWLQSFSNKNLIRLKLIQQRRHASVVHSTLNNHTSSVTGNGGGVGGGNGGNGGCGGGNNNGGGGVGNGGGCGGGNGMIGAGGNMLMNNSESLQRTTNNLTSRTIYPLNTSNLQSPHAHLVNHLQSQQHSVSGNSLPASPGASHSTLVRNATGGGGGGCHPLSVSSNNSHSLVHHPHPHHPHPHHPHYAFQRSLTHIPGSNTTTLLLDHHSASSASHQNVGGGGANNCANNGNNNGGGGGNGGIGSGTINVLSNGNTNCQISMKNFPLNNNCMNGGGGGSNGGGGNGGGNGSGTGSVASGLNTINLPQRGTIAPAGGTIVYGGYIAFPSVRNALYSPLVAAPQLSTIMGAHPTVLAPAPLTGTLYAPQVSLNSLVHLNPMCNAGSSAIRLGPPPPSNGGANVNNTTNFLIRTAANGGATAGPGIPCAPPYALQGHTAGVFGMCYATTAQAPQLVTAPRAS